MIQASVHIDISSLKRFRSRIESELKHATRGPVHDAILQWSARYRAFVQRRFNKYARGGSDETGPAWPRLKRGRKRGTKVRASVLIDTGTLRAALDPNILQAGALSKEVPFGIQVGYGGPARHPRANASIADIARFHDQGLGHLPERKIIVQPTSSLLRTMAADMQRGLKRLSEEIG